MPLGVTSRLKIETLEKSNHKTWRWVKNKPFLRRKVESVPRWSQAALRGSSRRDSTQLQRLLHRIKDSDLINRMDAYMILFIHVCAPGK